MKGWFDAFRNDGGPTLYNFSNRTAVTGDVPVITFLVIFATLYVAFLIIFPGIRKERFTTFCAVTISLLVGATIMVSLFGSCWHIAHATVQTTYRAFSNEKITAYLGAYVGLKHVNISLQAIPSANFSVDIDYNERFDWIDSYQMSDSFRAALKRGLPFPILTVAEYFSVGQDGLGWGGQYRAAGYYAFIMLWTSFSCWLLMNLTLIVVPRYGALLMTTCGFLLLGTVCGYFGMIPENPLVIHIDGTSIEFKFGWCFWLILISGSVCLTAGVIITTIEIINPYSFSTIFEVDYDTPYDRHIIIEDSRGRKYQKKRTSSGRLEEPAGIGHRILKRLSSKQKEEEPASSLNGNHLNQSEIGKQNFELATSLPWRYNNTSDIRNSGDRHIKVEVPDENSVVSSYSNIEDSPRHNGINNDATRRLKFQCGSDIYLLAVKKNSSAIYLTQFCLKFK